MSGLDIAPLTRLDQVVTDLGFGKYNDDDGRFDAEHVRPTMSLMIGTAGLPHVIMRFFTVPKVADARSSAGWALVFIALLYIDRAGCCRDGQGTTSMPRWNTAVAKGGDLYAPEASIKADERPDWMKQQKDGLLKFTDKNGDGRIQYYKRQDEEPGSREEGGSCRLEGQRTDGQRRHHRAGQPGNRAAAELGHRTGGRGWPGCRAVDRRRPADGDFVLPCRMTW